MIRFTIKSAIAIALVAWLALGTQGQTLSNSNNTVPLDVKQTVDPEQIFLKSSGNSPQEAEITLSLAAPAGERLPVDVFIAVDRSATVNLSQMTAIGVAILDQAGPQDRVGLVSFASEAKIDVPLTDNRRAIEDGLKNLRNVGRTAIGEGIFSAVNELVDTGRSEANWAIILLTDGRSNTGRAPLTQAQRAADNGVTIFSIGVGRSIDRAVMSEIARTTRGQFFEKFNDTAPRTIFKSFEKTIFARNVRLLRTLSAELNYESASENPPTKVTQNSNGTLTLEWTLDEFDFGQAWKTVFKVSGLKEGTFSLNAKTSKLTYADFRGRKVERDLPEASLRVRQSNRPPIAGFDFTPSNPSTNDEISFIDQSSDPDGAVASWLWNFGDGATSTQASPTHKYAQDGTYTVTLTVTDADKVTNVKTRTVKVETLKVTVKREINTYLPMDQTLQGQSFSVTVTIQINQRLSGLGLEENLSDDNWDLTSKMNDTGSYKKVTSKKNQWLFQEELAPGTVKTIMYEVLVKKDGKSGKISGSVSSAFPAFETDIVGKSAVKVVDKLPIRVLLSRWDVKTPEPVAGEQAAEVPCGAKLNLRLENKLSQDQIVAAAAWWADYETKDSKVVPKCFKELAMGSLNLKVMQELVAYWLTDTSVFESLPPIK